MQQVVKFNVNGGKPVNEAIQDYLDENTGTTINCIFSVNNSGDEIVIAVVDDGE